MLILGVPFLISMLTTDGARGRRTDGLVFLSLGVALLISMLGLALLSFYIYIYIYIYDVAMSSGAKYNVDIGAIWDVRIR